VECWTDTNGEPYKEGIQQEIRRHLATYGKDFAEFIETTIDLNYGDEEWTYTAHFFPKALVPANVVDPWKKNMMDKAKNPKRFTNWSHAWICGHQSHKTK
jgi:hypothetical protein